MADLLPMATVVWLASTCVLLAGLLTYGLINDRKQRTEEDPS